IPTAAWTALVFDGPSTSPRRRGASANTVSESQGVSDAVRAQRFRQAAADLAAREDPRLVGHLDVDCLPFNPIRRTDRVAVPEHFDVSLRFVPLERTRRMIFDGCLKLCDEVRWVVLKRVVEDALRLLSGIPGLLAAGVDGTEDGNVRIGRGRSRLAG